MSAAGLIAKNWLVLKETDVELHLVSRGAGKTRKVKKMYKGPLTIKTPAGNYRVPVERVGNFRFDSEGFFGDLFGTVVDRLGDLENCTSLDELNKKRRSFGLPEIKK